MLALRKPLRRAAAAAAAVLALASGGCVKMKEKTTVFPDGSGRYAFSMSLKKTTLAMLKSMAESLAKGMGVDQPTLDAGPSFDPLDMSPEHLQTQFQGFVAFTDPVRTEQGEWVTVSVTGYFEDVNKIRASQTEGMAGDSKVLTQFSFRRQGDGWLIENTGSLFDKMNETREGATGGSAPPSTDADRRKQEAARAKAKELLDGFEFSSEIVMPGKVVTADCMRKVDGRAARIWFSLDEMLDPAKMAALEDEWKGMGGKRPRVVCGPSMVDDADIKIFKAEMAAAKVVWQKRLSAANSAPPAAESRQPGGFELPSPSGK